MIRPVARSFVLALVAAVAGTSCVIVIGDGWDDGGFGRSRLRGSGVELREERTVDDFHAIRIEDWIDLEVRRADACSVEVEGDDNLVADVSTTVEDGTLAIRFEGGPYHSRLGLRAYVALPELSSVAVSGSSDVTLEDVQADDLALSISGSADLRASGTAQHLDVSISGSGDMFLDDLRASTAKVSVSGSGDVEINASDSLDVAVSGSGDVTYRGSPHTTLQVSGSGSVERR